MVASLFVVFAIAGCDGDAGAPGAAGAAGADGLDGAAGVSCWDTNQNGVADPTEDLNGDGVVDVFDCTATGAYESVQLHQGYFTDHDYQGTQSCLNCHGLIGEDVMTTAHFKWEGVATNMTGFEGEIHGKNDLINNFCIAVPSNEGRCTQCHAGYGYADDTFAFNDPETVDCLVCHDQTGEYAKNLTTAGLPVPTVDLNIVARSVGRNDGVPTIENCIDCHAKAGGGDNVKHGDLAMALENTTREFDVHMGTDGGDFECTECHTVMKNGDEVLSHGIGGMPYHSVDEGVMNDCESCHGTAAAIHVGSTVEPVINTHTTLACQVCHIPTFARETATKVEWYWEDAGQDISPIPVDPVTGRETYAKKKGSFVWANNVRPTLLYFDGKWDRMIIGQNDQWTDPLPVVLSKPTADYTTPGAMIYPFKKMIGNQPRDAGNQTMLVPHLFGGAGGPNPYWVHYDWDLALTDGAAYVGQTYTGAYEFVDTEMYLTVNHEVAPREQAYGYDGLCVDCHLQDQVDWQALGWTDDPLLVGGTRP
jgi:octaheme c-type cytochrome (tetrathionate reductase family)